MSYCTLGHRLAKMVLIQVKCERSRAEAQAPKLAPCCSRCCLCGRLSSRTETVSVPAQIIHALATRAGLHGHLVAVRRGFCGLGFREWWQCGHETGLPTSVDKGSRRPLRIAVVCLTKCCMCARVTFVTCYLFLLWKYSPRCVLHASVCTRVSGRQAVLQDDT